MLKALGGLFPIPALSDVLCVGGSRLMSLYAAAVGDWGASSEARGRHRGCVR